MYNTVFCFHAILPETFPFVPAVVLLSAIDTRARGGTEDLLIRTTGVRVVVDRHAVSDRGCPKLRHMEQASLELGYGKKKITTLTSRTPSDMTTAVKVVTLITVPLTLISMTFWRKD
jgi:hypothetical protein